MRVLIHLPNTVPAFQPIPAQLSALAARVRGHELVVVESETVLLAQLPSADAAVVWRFLPEWYQSAERLTHLFTPSAGHEPLAADPNGRVARHFGTFHGAIMAESLLGMIAFMNRRFGEAVRAQQAREWNRAPYFETRRLSGQVALIIGLGAIGQHCARLLAAAGMTIYGVRRNPELPAGPAERVFQPDQLLEALPLADHVACVLPGDTGTRGLLGDAAFSSMKANACVYNLGRGNAIDEGALLRALSAHRIAGAFLDVFADEPLPAESPLWDAPNLYLTPHASAISVEYLDLYFDELATELNRIA